MPNCLMLFLWEEEEGKEEDNKKEKDKEDKKEELFEQVITTCNKYLPRYSRSVINAKLTQIAPCYSYGRGRRRKIAEYRGYTVIPWVKTI